MGKEHFRQRNPGAKALGQENVSMLREHTAGAGDVARSQSTGDAGVQFSEAAAVESDVSRVLPPCFQTGAFHKYCSLCNDI